MQRGIALLRDEALRYNPHRAELYTELATFYQHKLGLDLDPAHRWYKENFADRRLDYGPNLDLIGKVHDTFEEALAADPDRHEYIGRAHKNFHLEVVPLLYTHNRLAEAAAWFRNLQEEYPEAVPPERGLDEFVIDRVTRLGTRPSPERARGIIEGLLVTGYRHYALGDEPQAVGAPRE